MKYRKILVGLDGSDGSFKAFEHGVDLASRFRAELHAVSVAEVPRYPGATGETVEAEQAAKGRYGQTLQRAKLIAGEQGIELQCHVVVGHQIKSIVEFIKERRYDLLVIGFMGHSALYERVMGSTCQGLVRLADCTVLVVK
jgi:nucleotide-binding universal stress UspA family protein